MRQRTSRFAIIVSLLVRRCFNWRRKSLYSKGRSGSHRAPYLSCRLILLRTALLNKVATEERSIFLKTFLRSGVGPRVSIMPKNGRWSYANNAGWLENDLRSSTLQHNFDTPIPFELVYLRSGTFPDRSN